MSHHGAENPAPLQRSLESRHVKPLSCRLRTAVVAVAGWSLVPAVLWWMAAAGVLAFSAAIAAAVISFEVRNARGEGGYFDGLAPTCDAPDDTTRELGDPTEASLREALHYIATGQCLARPARAGDESGVVL